MTANPHILALWKWKIDEQWASDLQQIFVSYNH